MTEQRRYALIGPNFFAYIQAIRQNLEQRGIPSAFFDERHANSIPVKILYRLGYYHRFQGRKRQHLDGIAQQVIGGGYTDAYLIDVEVCDPPFVQRLVDAGVRVHLYMWDSARNKPSYLKYLHLLHGKGSFDPEDCEAHGLAYIPLFAEDVFSAKVQGLPADHARTVDLSFCGTLHSDRAVHVAALQDFAQTRGLKTGLMLYFHSRWLLLVKGLVHLSNARFVRTIATKGYTKADIFKLLARSRYVFDVPHAGQVGLTARTFEVLRSGARLVTLNRRALDLLPPDLLPRVVWVPDVAGLAAIDFSATWQDPPLTDEQDHYLSINRFVDALLVLSGLETPPRPAVPA